MQSDLPYAIRCLFVLLFVLPCAIMQVNAQQDKSTLAEELRQLYRFDLLPEYRTDSKLELISTYDTTGGNDDGFSGKYSFVRKEGNYLVLADLKGPGVVNRIHSPTPTNKMLAFYFDGEKTPRIRIPFIELFSGKIKPFIKPLVGNEVGGYYCYFPIPYRKSLKIVYEGNDERFHQIQFRTYPKDAQIKSFDTALTREESAELDKVSASWRQVGVPYWLNTGYPDRLDTVETKFRLRPGDSAVIFQSAVGGRIMGVQLDRDKINWGRGVLLEAQWDNEPVPAILSPADDFFGYFFGQPSAQGLLLGSFSGKDYCYMPMPFDHSARITLRLLPVVNKEISGIARIIYARVQRNEKAEGKLYTVWRRETEPEIGKPYLIFNAEGKGHQVATVLQAQGLVEGTTEFFEGDDVAVADGEMRAHGGGSEDYFNGGWYWILDRWDKGISLPVSGSLGYSLAYARTGGYRFFLDDKVSFEHQYQLTIEHGPEGNKSPVDYTSVAYYYGDRPRSSVMDPSWMQNPVRTPRFHEYDVRDFMMTLGSGTTARFKGYSSGLEISGVIPVKGFVVDDAERGEAKGEVRIDLSEMPAGDYKLYISYDENPDGGEYSVWRRQQQIADWMGTYASKIRRVQRKYLGNIRLTDQIKSVTIRTRAGKEGGKLLLIRKLGLEESSSGENK